jgi:hypothetical protein
MITNRMAMESQATPARLADGTFAGPAWIRSAAVDPLHIPVAAGALLLLLSGVQKVLRPLLTHRVLRIAGLPSHPSAVRVLGVIELAVGMGTLLSGSWWWPAALGALYAAFAAFVVLALWRNAPLSSCGCFGAAETPPTPLHAGINAAIAAVALLAATDPPDAPLEVVTDGGASAVGFVGGSLFVASVVYAALTQRFGSRATRSHPGPH